MEGVSFGAVFPELTAIIPVGGKSPDLTSVLSWLTADVLTKIKLIFVFDGLESNKSRDFHSLLSKFPHSNMTILETDCKNPGGARNYGIEFVDTKWTTFWDADDLPDVNNILNSVADCSPKASVIRGGYSIQNSKDGKVTAVHEDRITEDMAVLFKSGPGLWRYIFKTESILKVRFPELSMAEDQIYLIKALQKSDTIQDVSKNFYTYRIGSSNQLTNSKKKLNDLSQAFIELVRIYSSMSNGDHKKSSIQTIIARMILTSRLSPTLFVRMVLIFFATRRISISMKTGIIIRIINQISVGLSLK